MRKKIRTLRHWKQRFDKNADFIFRRRIQYGPKSYEPGAKIPKALKDNPTKLRRFWESGTIELALFDEPDVATGTVKATPAPKAKSKAKAKPKKKVKGKAKAKGKVTENSEDDSWLDGDGESTDGEALSEL